MSSFEPIPDSKLQVLADEQLVEYMRSSRTAGLPEEVRRASGILLWRDYGRIKQKVGLKVPPGSIEDVAGSVMLSVLEATITASSIGEVRSLVNTITARRIADFTDKRARTPTSDPLAEEHDGEDQIYPGGQPSTPDGTSQVAADELIEQALEGISEQHRRVIELGGKEHDRFEGRSAREVAEQIRVEFGNTISEANVHQILSRFRLRLKKLVDPGDGNG